MTPIKLTVLAPSLAFGVILVYVVGVFGNGETRVEYQIAVTEALRLKSKLG